jgi:hypothetical protein
MPQESTPNKKVRDILVAILILILIAFGVLAAVKPELFTASIARSSQYRIMTPSAVP